MQSGLDVRKWANSRWSSIIPNILVLHGFNSFCINQHVLFLYNIFCRARVAPVRSTIQKTHAYFVHLNFFANTKKLDVFQLTEIVVWGLATIRRTAALFAVFTSASGKIPIPRHQYIWKNWLKLFVNGMSAVVTTAHHSKNIIINLSHFFWTDNFRWAAAAIHWVWHTRVNSINSSGTHARFSSRIHSIWTNHNN